MTQAPATTDGLRRFPCTKCGAKLEFAPGADSLRCPYCTTINRIEVVGEVQELDLLDYLQRLEQSQPQDIVSAVKCGACAAEVTVPQNATSFSCPFCGSNLVSESHQCSIIKPNAVLPFKVTREEATTAFRRWIKSLWWAPGALKRRSMLDASLTGIYLPHWTYDAYAQTAYVGERGDAYWETQWVRVNGRMQARPVRKVRWSPASGHVENRFNDVLVPASKTLDQSKVRDLMPWDLASCLPYADDYLAGFRAERYQVSLPDGFEEAKQRMAPVIHSTICQDIGGDEQRVHQASTRYSDLTFKHLLLPLWLSAYRYSGKVYQFMVNARTGEVQGQRPYSAAKITLAVIMAIVFVLVLVLVFARK